VAGLACVFFRYYDLFWSGLVDGLDLVTRQDAVVGKLWAYPFTRVSADATGTVYTQNTHSSQYTPADNTPHRLLQPQEPTQKGTATKQQEHHNQHQCTHKRHEINFTNIRLQQPMLSLLVRDNMPQHNQKHRKQITQ